MTLKTHAEFTLITCCICGKQIDPCSFYASYNDVQKAHMNCWTKARAVNHDLKKLTEEYKQTKLARL